MEDEPNTKEYWKQRKSQMADLFHGNARRGALCFILYLALQIPRYWYSVEEIIQYGAEHTWAFLLIVTLSAMYIPGIVFLVVATLCAFLYYSFSYFERQVR